MLRHYAIKVLPTLQLSQITSLMGINGLTSQVIFNTDAHLWHCFWHSPQALLTASSSPTEAIPKPSSFSLTNPGGDGTHSILPTSCLGNHRVNLFNKLTLMKIPYKKI